MLLEVSTAHQGGGSPLLFREGEEEEERRGGDEAVTPAQGEVSSKGAPSRWGQGADQETILFEELGGEAHLFSKAFEEEAELFLDLPKTEGGGVGEGRSVFTKTEAEMVGGKEGVEKEGMTQVFKIVEERFRNRFRVTLAEKIPEEPLLMEKPAAGILVLHPYPSRVFNLIFTS